MLLGARYYCGFNPSASNCRFHSAGASRSRSMLMPRGRQPRPGGLFRISGPADVSIEGTYLQVIPNRKVVFTWGGVEGLKPGQSTVEFLLLPDGDGTLVRLRHYGLPPPTIESHRRGWILSGLAKLKDAAEGRPPTRLCLSDLAAQRGDP
jgi:hypothetical protein